MKNQYSAFNFIILISILLFSFLLISQNYEKPVGNFTPPAPPQINIPTIAANEKIYIFGAGKVAKLDSVGITYIHSDYLGSASLETDASRNIVATNTYYPFGASLAKTGTEKYIFTGKELDKTQLQYFGARYYDQDTGRFTQVDPMSDGYEYAANNPMIFTDPDGNSIAAGQATWSRAKPPTWPEVKAAILSIQSPISWGIGGPTTNLGGALSSGNNAIGVFSQWLDPLGAGALAAGGINFGWGFVKPGATYYVHPTKNILVAESCPGAICVSSDVAEVIISRSGSVKRPDVSNFLYNEKSGYVASLDGLMEEGIQNFGTLADLPRTSKFGSYDWNKWILSGDFTYEVNFNVMRGYVQQALDAGYITSKQANVLTTGFNIMEKGTVSRSWAFHHKAIANELGISRTGVDYIMKGEKGETGALGGFRQFLEDKDIIP